MKPGDLINRTDLLLQRAKEVLATRRSNYHFPDSVDSGKFSALRTSTLSFLSMTYGKEHPNYTEFNRSTTDGSSFSNAQKAHEILLSIREEIEGGWIFTIKSIVAAEIFSDFMEMAEHLLDQGYKDPAAVMFGSVLEENLRQLCIRNNIVTEAEKNEKITPKKADRLNSDLANAEVYSKLDQKSVTMWLDLRNKAAHGKYDEYTKDQVVIMKEGIIDFITRNKV